MNKAASELAKLRWSRCPPEERSKHVGHTGGRQRIYPQCPRYRAHRFTNDRCPCGYVREPIAAK